MSIAAVAMGIMAMIGAAVLFRRSAQVPAES
jgi:hypothetical protein